MSSISAAKHSTERPHDPLIALSLRDGPNAPVKLCCWAGGEGVNPQWERCDEKYCWTALCFCVVWVTPHSWRAQWGDRTRSFCFGMCKAVLWLRATDTEAGPWPGSLRRCIGEFLDLSYCTSTRHPAIVQRRQADRLQLSPAHLKGPCFWHKHQGHFIQIRHFGSDCCYLKIETTHSCSMLWNIFSSQKMSLWSLL